MLAKISRLTADKDYAKLFKRGGGANGPAFSVRYLSNGLGRTRLGFVVGLKVSKKAVVRNLLKRRMREVIRPLLPSVAVGADIAVIAKPAAANLSFDDVRKNLVLLFERARLLQKK